MDSAVVEQPPEYRLINIHGLDLVHVHLHGMAFNEPTLVDNASVRNRELSDPANEPSVQEANCKSDPKYGKRTIAKISAGIPIRSIVFQCNKGGADDEKQDRFDIDDPMQSPSYEDLFIRLKDGADITHGAISLVSQANRKVCHGLSDRAM